MELVSRAIHGDWLRFYDFYNKRTWVKKVQIQTIGFLDLPIELRLLVYRYMYPSNGYPMDQYYGILLSCSAIYLEASEEILSIARKDFAHLERKWLHEFGIVIDPMIPAKIGFLSNTRVLVTPPFTGRDSSCTSFILNERHIQSFTFAVFDGQLPLSWHIPSYMGIAGSHGNASRIYNYLLVICSRIVDLILDESAREFLRENIRKSQDMCGKRDISVQWRNHRYKWVLGRVVVASLLFKSNFSTIPPRWVVEETVLNGRVVDITLTARQGSNRPAC
ncbi:uncharacterized protein K460DRAFT_403467 [Cucurbitaria berberidis CBS 394.84]|uniref:Uncharacterized protein n=1 Tax=Cucurbitaria berberidis CBS 394.84 TaxID=1168544 RepID=A0A9P4GNA2_9PLEO|nr:uncharacterized protein K460DRAFT_403467 [Cucurbitaria berberidis CBS 394.84]KAF1848171.1 hypothetical protein K460DRAFT_403467 [Cucurbitaria berberidis CBS 394.84]